ncbi:MAG: DUF1592 domain-containing protein [Myxococcales bacterium]|nr:DUF1592 domain-containing protein [Myxococcales bacterium]
MKNRILQIMIGVWLGLAACGTTNDPKTDTTDIAVDGGGGAEPDSAADTPTVVDVVTRVDIVSPLGDVSVDTVADSAVVSEDADTEDIHVVDVLDPVEDVPEGIDIAGDDVGAVPDVQFFDILQDTSGESLDIVEALDISFDTQEPDLWVEPDPCDLPQDPGRVTLRRLNRFEYDRTMKDLLGVTETPAESFPADDTGYGFDNIGDVLSMSPLLVEKFDLAAEQLVKTALFKPKIPFVETQLQAEELGAANGKGVEYKGFYLLLYTVESVIGIVNLSHDATYTLSARAFGQQAGPEPTKMRFRVDGNVVTTFDVLAVEANPEVYAVDVQLSAGAHSFSVDFINDYYAPDDPDPSQKDRNLVLDWIAVTGPYGVPEPPDPPMRKAIMICDPAKEGLIACSLKIVTAFAQRAWRREITLEEAQKLASFVDLALSQGDSFDKGIELALIRTLMSPHFLYRVELDPEPTSSVPHSLTDYELASRLSYFLWGSMPDAELFELAKNKTLNDDEVLKEQVQRMMTDPKADALMKGFVGQWLYLRNLDNVFRDSVAYPDFNAELALAMRKETELFVQEFFDQGYSLLDLLDADWSYVNGPLAKLYGIDGVNGDDFVKVSVDPDKRGGLLSHASVLTVTSHTTRTSPVKRGKWVLGQLLCQEPPPPPPEVPPLVESEVQVGDLKEIMKQHVSDPLCQGCHMLMDPIGFGLENYDAIGAWREQVNGFAIDPSGELLDGMTFETPADLAELIRQDPAYVHCMVEKIFTYSLGRGTELQDGCLQADIADQFVQNGHRFSDLIVAMVLSEVFRTRRGEPLEEVVP